MAMSITIENTTAESVFEALKQLPAEESGKGCGPC
jgi:hypothetical protein